MPQDKNKIVFLGFIGSLLINFALCYFLVDNAITSNYLEMDILKCQREKNDSIKYLNVVIEKNRGFNFSEANNSFLKHNDTLFKAKEDGYTLLGTLCFKKAKETYKASYCSDVF